MKITPTAEMIDETTRPQRTLKPPLAETFAMSAALLIKCGLLASFAGCEGFIVCGRKSSKAVCNVVTISLFMVRAQTLD
jgi:hypothetical protein